jgi:hypothetical protein
MNSAFPPHGFFGTGRNKMEEKEDTIPEEMPFEKIEREGFY